MCDVFFSALFHEARTTFVNISTNDSDAEEALHESGGVVLQGSPTTVAGDRHTILPVLILMK